MSAAIAFDSHRFVKSLTASGFTEAQAEALALEQIHLLEANLANKSDLAAVKSDLGAVRSDLEVKIEQVRSDLEVKIEQVKSDLEVKIEQVKADLEVKMEQVKGDLEVKIEQVRGDLEVKIEQVRAEVHTVKASLLKWMAGALTAHLAIVVAVLQFLLRTA